MLYEMALRLYDPLLREIAPKHLKAYADAALTINRLLPAAVAWELAQDDLSARAFARCAGSVPAPVSRWNADSGHRLAGGGRRGIVIARPGPPGSRPESELARAGVRGGERLLAIDGQKFAPYLKCRPRFASMLSGRSCGSWCSGLGLSARARRQTRERLSEDVKGQASVPC